MDSNGSGTSPSSPPLTRPWWTSTPLATDELHRARGQQGVLVRAERPRACARRRTSRRVRSWSNSARMQVVPGDVTPDVVRTWTGRQGIYPLPYRGWGVAGLHRAHGDKATDLIKETGFRRRREHPSRPEAPRRAASTTCAPARRRLPDRTRHRSVVRLPAVLDPVSLGGGGRTPSTRPVGGTAPTSPPPPTGALVAAGADTVDLGVTPARRRRAVTRICITAPSASLAFGFGPLGASFGVGPSFGLVDFEDMNGDGFPDVITPDNVTYTSQRGILVQVGPRPDLAQRRGQPGPHLRASGGLDAGPGRHQSQRQGQDQRHPGQLGREGRRAADTTPDRRRIRRQHRRQLRPQR